MWFSEAAFHLFVIFHFCILLLESTVCLTVLHKQNSLSNLLLCLFMSVCVMSFSISLYSASSATH